ncbi:hypothetical protein [Butyrivibrio sp. INlla14]|uniref:hypothetical protein n=1 Tax=Butyrivibrio sp. INlla14 TaxID=1520808 RepID=UPI000876844E|nr:hypothetical protein [Butyrivibrio sp. INlla14]SCY23512.1 hypothetical protein SAMN02910371_01514 [Butyrivibrio sp. INlla14]
MNQSKGTGKLVGGIFCGIIAVINLLLFLVFGVTAIAIKSEPELIEESLAAQGYGPELMGPVTSVINGFAIFAFAIMVIMIILCVKLCGAYSKQAKLAKQNAAMGYNQFQNGQMPYGQMPNGQFQNQQFANQQFQNQQFQNQQFQNGQTTGGQFSGQNQNNTTM